MSATLQRSLKNLFQISFFTLLIAASSIVLSVDQKSFSQIPEQDNSSAIEPTDFLTYQNTTYGITIQHPSDWTVYTGDSPGDPIIDIVGFYAPLESRIDNYAERLWIAQEHQSFSEDFDLAEYAEQIVSNYESIENDFNLIEIDTETARLGNNTNGNPAYRIVFTSTLQPDNIEIKTMEIGTLVGDKIYIINYYAEVTSYDQYLPTIEEMINSIELTGTGVTDVPTTEDNLGGDDSGTVTAENQTGDLPTNEDNNINATTQQGIDIDFLKYATSFEEETLSINYPSDWEVSEYEQDPSSIVHWIVGFASPVLSPITDPYQESVSIAVEELNENMTLDQYFEFTVNSYRTQGAEIIRSSDDIFLTSNNNPAYEVEYTTWNNELGRMLRVLEVGTVIGDKAYFVKYFGDDINGFSRFLPIAQQMIGSFEINEAKRTRGAAGTLPDPGSQYLELSYEEWRSDNINVRILVNPDTEEQSSKYVDEVENAINSWSQALKEYSGNPNAWNFNVSTSIGYVGSVQIGPGLEADLVIEVTGDPAGISCSNVYGAAMPHPYDINMPVTVHVLTSCLDAETGQLIEFTEDVVYSTALHEFAHALGLGHAFNINNDLMCSAEPDIYGNPIPTCEYYEPDVQEISEADVAALVYKYGIDGFELPNTQLSGQKPYYEVGTPIVTDGGETSGSTTSSIGNGQ